MQALQALEIGLLFLTFIGMTLLMFYRLLPALLALPLLAVLIALIGGLNPDDKFSSLDLITQVLGKGPLKLSGAYVVAMFGGMLSLILQKTGVAESFIKKGAELAGDKPWTISVVMLLLIALLFTTIGGLGAIIMVATIVLPVLAAVGVGPMTSVGIFLFGISIGGTLNVGNWALYREVLNLKAEQIQPFALLIFALLFAFALVYITLQLYFDGHELDIATLVRNGVLALLLIGGGTAGWMLAVPAETKAGLTQLWGP
ncbi:MAG: citrate transporter, partial [Candidatus Sericytochromatia bacterium]